MNRTIIFFEEGIALPEIDYKHRIQGCLLFYLVKDGKLTTPPIEFWRKGFRYRGNSNNYDYIILERRDAIFKCVEFETIGFEDEILTFELVPPRG